MSANKFKIGDLVQYRDSNEHMGIIEGIGIAKSNSWCAVRWLNSNNLPFDKATQYHISNIEPYKKVTHG